MYTRYLFFLSSVAPALCLWLITQGITGDFAHGNEILNPIPGPTWIAMQGKSWHASIGCPAREQLALLHLPYLDFQGRAQKGEMIVAQSVARDVIKVFSEIFDNGKFRIASMQLIDKFDGDDTKSIEANNTSAFNCRAVTGGVRLSEHAFGKAIDINPVQNPYVTRRTVEPASGEAYASAEKRVNSRVGMIRQGDIVIKAFAGIGWKWGGTWNSVRDYQHFSASGP
jgi:D-alanyl-D-alanine carboxypeptidase